MRKAPAHLPLVDVSCHRHEAQLMDLAHGHLSAMLALAAQPAEPRDLQQLEKIHPVLEGCLTISDTSANQHVGNGKTLSIAPGHNVSAASF